MWFNSENGKFSQATLDTVAGLSAVCECAETGVNFSPHPRTMHVLVWVDHLREARGLSQRRGLLTPKAPRDFLQFLSISTAPSRSIRPRPVYYLLCRRCQRAVRQAVYSTLGPRGARPRYRPREVYTGIGKRSIALVHTTAAADCQIRESRVSPLPLLAHSQSDLSV